MELVCHHDEARLSGASAFPGGHQAGDRGFRSISTALPIGLPWRRVAVSWFNTFNVIDSVTSDFLGLPAGINARLTFFNASQIVAAFSLVKSREMFPFRLVQQSAMDWATPAMGGSEILLRLPTPSTLAAILTPRTIVATADRVTLDLEAAELQDRNWTFDLYLSVESFNAPPGT